jgi:hypothetical protein
MVFDIDQETLRTTEKITYSNFQAPVLRKSPPTSTRRDSGEAHPGHLVDFTSPDYYPGESEPLPQQTKTSANSAFNLHLDTNAYHTYLASTRHRRNSFPPPSEYAARCIREEIAMLQKLETLDTEAKTYNTHFNTNMSKDANTRKRAWTLEHRDANKRRSPTPPTSPTTKGEESLDGMTGLKRSSSDPSTEAFLSHIRASLSARKTQQGKCWSTYPVFTDEAEKGFLDDAPL